MVLYTSKVNSCWEIWEYRDNDGVFYEFGTQTAHDSFCGISISQTADSLEELRAIIQRWYDRIDSTNPYFDGMAGIELDFLQFIDGVLQHGWNSVLSRT